GYWSSLRFLRERRRPCATYPVSLHDALPICFVAVLLGGGEDGVGGQGQGLLPGDPHERLLAAQVRLGVAHRVGQVGLAHHRVLEDRKSTRLNSSHVKISYAVFCLKKKK